MHTELLSQPWIERRIGRGGEALVVTGEHCSRGVKYTEDFRVVSRVSFFNILFSRIRLVVISFRFVTVTMHGEGRNQVRGLSQVLHELFLWNEESRLRKAEEGQEIRNPFRHIHTH